jgi:hypothetical protein
MARGVACGNRRSFQKERDGTGHPFLTEVSQGKRPACLGEISSGLSVSYRRTGAKNRFGACIPVVVIRRRQLNQQILAQKNYKMAAIPGRRGAVLKKCCAATLINASL